MAELRHTCGRYTGKKLWLRSDVIVTCVADEEATSLCIQAVLEDWSADAAIVTEPTGFDQQVLRVN